MAWEAPASCSASSSPAHGARTRCRGPIAFRGCGSRKRGKWDGFGRWMVRRPGRVGGFYRKKLHVRACTSLGFL
jgi:hypothetical protein